MFQAILVYVPGYLSLRFIFGGFVCGFKFFQIDVSVVLQCFSNCLAKVMPILCIIFNFLAYFFFLFKLIPTKVVSFCRVVG